MIPQSKIDEIINAAHVEDVVGEVVRLKKRGANLQGLCPFHNEKTPSFSVSPAKGIYKCFGCGKAGNAVNFVMENQAVGYIEALKLLAEKYGIEWPQQENVNIEQERLLKTEKESLQIFNQWSAKFFEDNLWSTEAGQQIGLTYFEERGFRNDIIKKFQLGYSTDEWDHLLLKAKEAQFDEEVILKSGLVKQSEQGKLYDAYRGRVIFPIHGVNGKIIAFAGRQLKKDDKSPKYVNSPETALYIKSNELYGLHFAKNSIRSNDFVYLVEGYTDVITLHQAGVENVVASSGTSLTENQIKLIKRQTDFVTVLYDGDAAGIKASLRGVDMLLEQGLNVKVVLFPDGEDPDSYCKKVGSELFVDYLQKQAKDFILFKVGLLKKDAANDPVKIAGIAKEIVESISKIPDNLKRMAFIKECSILLDINEQALVSELNKTRSVFLTQKEKEWVTAEPIAEMPEEILPEQKFDQHSQETNLIRVMLQYGHMTVSNDKNLASYILEQIDENEIEIEHELYQIIMNEIRHLIANGVEIGEQYFVNHTNPVISNLAANVLVQPYELSDAWEKRYDVYMVKPDKNYLNEAISVLLHLQLKNTQKLLVQNAKEIEQAQHADDETNLQLTLMIHKALKEKEHQLARQIGAVIIK